MTRAPITMRSIQRATTAFAALASLVLAVSGCDAAKAAYDDAAQLEVAGSFREAATAYRKVCTIDAQSKVCPAATSRATRLDVRAGWQAAQQGRYDAAKLLLDAAAASDDAQARQAGKAILRHPDVVQGLAWEAASRIADKTKARAAIEAIAETDTVVAAKAREWLDQNGLELLLGDIEAACSDTGKGSCVELGRELAREEETPQVIAARQRVATDWRRVSPLLRDAEKMLRMRAALHAREQKILGCIARTNLAEDYGREDCEHHLPAAARAVPGAPSEALPAPIELFTQWRLKLEAIHDPALVKVLTTRWEAAERDGVYDAATWPPAG